MYLHSSQFNYGMATMTIHVFPTYAYCDQRRYMQRYLRKPPDMEVRSFTTRLIQLNKYLPYFLQERSGQLVTSLPDDNIKEILYVAMLITTWEKKMVEQGYNYLDGTIHSMSEFFETRNVNIEKSIPPSVPSRNNRKTKKKGQGKRNLRLLVIMSTRIEMKNLKVKSFVSTMTRVNIPQTSALHSRYWLGKQNRRRENTLRIKVHQT